MRQRLLIFTLVTLAFSGVLQKGTKTKVAHKRAEVLRHPYVLEGPQTRGQSPRWPTSGRKCYVAPTFLGVREKGLKIGPHRALGKNPMLGILKGGPLTKFFFGSKGPPCPHHKRTTQYLGPYMLVE